jgi:hypothetical protein
MQRLFFDKKRDTSSALIGNKERRKLRLGKFY